MTFREYIRSLAPTMSGLLAVGICLLAIPLLGDIFFVMSSRAAKAPVTMSSTLVNGYLFFIPWLLVYLLINFFHLKILFHYFKHKAY